MLFLKIKKMKKIFLYVVCFTIISSCDFKEVLSENNSFKFKLRNYTSNDYSNSKLFIGAKDSNDMFIKTDSVSYTNLISNISHSNEYLTGDELPFGSYPASNGYYYYKINGEQFVKIPFPFEFGGTIKINEEKILKISDQIDFLLELSDGRTKYIEGINLIEGISNPNSEGNIYVHIYIKDTIIIGETNSKYTF